MPTGFFTPNLPLAGQSLGALSVGLPVVLLCRPVGCDLDVRLGDCDACFGYSRYCLLEAVLHLFAHSSDTLAVIECLYKCVARFHVVLQSCANLS